MKRIGLLSTTVILFAVSLYAAYLQGTWYAFSSGLSGTGVAAGPNVRLSFFWSVLMSVFSPILNGLTALFGGSVLAGMIVLALIVELVTLFPAVSVQLIQKQIHLFHKKLVNRFACGELSVSSTKHELDILYSVNERMHRRGAWLIGSQVLIFLLVFAGLYFTTQIPSAMPGTFETFKFAMMSRPVDFSLPLLAGLAYLLHSLVKISLKQREDYIDSRQVYAALGIAVVASGLVFYFAGAFPVLLTVYFLTQITFATMRYILVEENAQAWGRAARHQLIHLLRTSELHKNKLERVSRKFNHLPVIRHLNFHLLEEAMSMSLVLFILLSAVHFM